MANEFFLLTWHEWEQMVLVGGLPGNTVGYLSQHLKEVRGKTLHVVLSPVE